MITVETVGKIRRRHFVKVVDPRMPESAVAFDETLIIDAIQHSGLVTTEVRHGSWAGRAEYFDYQDVVFATQAGV